MSFVDDTPRPRRKPSLTPMIDVVFLLLVFFMLASRFGTDEVLPLPLASQGGSGYQGAPRLVDVLPEGLKLNGVEITAEALLPALQDLSANPADTVILRGQDQAPLQRVVDVVTALRGAGHTNIVLVE
ncbi:ExbD/TolR family protein [Oceanicola sp. S124]|uniref:ExbD/TolR family protein n=1 Tax=Oceanicola sp. S124 TaxID=1042378 RepID=UPI000255820B|nr:biopolymer transporter ExbD [Oceanicola sp. S124]